MIRFIYIGEQITEGEHTFAFWNTTTDSFLKIGDDYVFDTTDEFISAVNSLPAGTVLPRAPIYLLDMARSNLRSRGVKP